MKWKMCAINRFRLFYSSSLPPFSPLRNVLPVLKYGRALAWTMTRVFSPSRTPCAYAMRCAPLITSPVQPAKAAARKYAISERGIFIGSTLRNGKYKVCLS